MFLAFQIGDIIRIPFGYILEWLYNWTANYGVALILFSLIWSDTAPLFLTAEAVTQAEIDSIRNHLAKGILSG